MTEPIDPTRGVAAVGPVEERRSGERRSRDRRVKERRADAAAGKASLPVAAKPPRATKPDQDPAAAAAAFAAQLMGQTGQKRGLKGGPKVLESARSAYLEAEYSGPADRRLPAGKIKKTEA